MSTLYHVSPKDNLDSIYERGILPEKSRGKKQLIWLVDEQRLPWALAHCSVQHDCKVSDLMILRVVAGDKHVKRTRLSGIYTYAFVLNGYLFAWGDQWMEGQSEANEDRR